MKRILLLLALVATLALPTFAAALAAHPDAGVFTLAAELPADMDMYAGLRIDDRAIADVDGLLGRIAGFAAEFGRDDLPGSVRDVLLQMPGVTAAHIDADIAWAGDVIAVGMRDLTARRPLSVTLVALDDRAAAEQDFVDAAGDEFESAGQQGRFTVYENRTTTALFGDDVMIVLANAAPDDIETLTGGDYPRLSDREDFASSLAELPEDDYIVGIYASEAAVDRMVASGTGPAMSGSIAMGAGLLDSSTLAVDFVVPMPALYGDTPVDPHFARYIPEDAGVFFHGTGLGSLFDASLDPAARAQVSRAMSSGEIDYDSLIAWLSGDIAVFASFDFAVLMSELMAAEPDPSAVADELAFGVVLESPGADEAAVMAQAIRSAVGMVPTNSGVEIVVGAETVGATNVTVYALQSTADPDVSVRLGLAANEDVFVFGTYNAVESVLNSPAARAGTGAVQVWLPGATMVWYYDGETLGGVVAAMILYVGPAAARTFEEINDSLLSEPRATPAQQPTPAPSALGIAAAVDVEQLIDRVGRFLRYVTMSTRPTPSGTLFRATITLGE